jgi:hypothetical protein
MLEISSQSLERIARLFFGLPGVDMATVQDSFWGCHHLALLCLAAKLSHVGVDVDGVCCQLWLTGRVQSPLASVVPSCHTTEVGVA